MDSDSYHGYGDGCMRQGVLTNQIDEIKLDQDRLNDRFSAYRVTYNGISNEKLNQRKPEIAAAIHKSGPVLSVADCSWDRSYYALLHKGDTLKLSADDLAIKQVSFSSIPDFISPRLLLMAIPRLQSHSPLSSHKRIDADGLYYLVDLKSIGGSRTDKKMLITAGCDVTGDWSFTLTGNRPAIRNFSVGCVSFKPLEQVTYEDGSLSKKHQKKSRYNFDEWSHVVSKDVEGHYIKEGFVGSKNRVDAVNISNEELEAFELSRVGVLSQCLQDIDSIFDGALTIILKRIPYDVHEQITDTPVIKAYRKIWEIMKSIPVNIIDHTDNSRAVETLQYWLDKDGFVFSLSGQPKEECSNILLVDPPETYKAKQSEDPYITTKRKYPEAAIQACYPDSLLKADKIKKGARIKNSVFEVLIKELLIKHEVCKKELLFPVADLPEGVEFILPFKHFEGKTAKWSFHRMVYQSGNIEFDTLSDGDIENIRDFLDHEHDKYIVGDNRGRGSRPPFLYWPETSDYMFFVETGTVALPEFEEMKKLLVEIEHSRSQPIDRSFLEAYCDDHTESIISEICRELLDEDPSKESFNYSLINQAIKKRKIKGRNKAKEDFYQWVETELGLLWKRSLKQKQDGYLNANLGFFFNREEGVYYVGAKGSPQQTVANFSKIYRLATSLSVIPDQILGLFKAVHIRHKQMTVLPYPFKHVREYAQKLALKNG